jgi:hypothetical protein
MVLSFLLQPSWLGDWLGQVGSYSSYTALGSPVWIIVEYYLGLGSLGDWALNLVFYGLMLWAWYGLLWQDHQERFLWVVTVILAVTHLVAPRTATPHYVVYILPLIFYFSIWARQRRNLWTALVLLALLILPWLHFIVTVEGEFEHPRVYLPLPFAIILLMWLTRRMWWSQAHSPEVDA